MEPQQSIEAGNWVVLATYMGFSFFVGFAIGFAVKTFLKIMFFLVGTLLLVLFTLQYNNLIQVNWTGFERIYDSLILWITPHLGGLKSFATANLSSATMASLGLFFGLRKK